MKGINQLAQACSEKNSFLMVQNKEMLKTLKEIVRESLLKDGECEIPGICVITLEKKNGHVSTNPRTKERINVPDKIVPRVRLNKSLKKEFTEVIED